MATLAPATNPSGNPILDAFTQYHDKVSALNIGAGRDMSPKATTPPPSTAVGTIGKPSEGIGKMSQIPAPDLTAYVDPQNPGWHASEAASAIAMATKAPTGSPDISVNPDKITGIVNNLRKDYGLTREQAIGAVGWMGYESGNMSVMQEYGHSGTNSGWGWAQWTGPRRTNFMEYAAANKLDPASDEANYGFLKHELDTGYNHVLPKLQKATTVEEANQVWGKYFEGMREGGPGVPAFKQHADRAALYDTLIPLDEQSQAQGQSANSAATAASTPLDSNFAKNQAYIKPGDHNYTTELSKQQEQDFRSWVKDNKIPFNPSEPKQDYDMRGFYKAMQSGDPIAKNAINPNDHQIHYPDYWKTPYHKSFSNESQWADPTKAPAWNDKDQLVLPSGDITFDERAQ